jgi:hypothetical protein
MEKMMNKEVTLLELLTPEIFNGVDFSLLFGIAIYIAFAWFISHFAKRPFFRIFWIVLGLYLVLNSVRITDFENLSFTFTADTLFGIGFILPHIGFIFRWLYSIYVAIKMMSVNSYYFVVTIIFKFVRFFRWLYSLYKSFVGLFSRDKSSDSNGEHRKEYTRDYGGSHNKGKSEQRKQERQEENYSYNDSDNESSYSDGYNDYDTKNEYQETHEKIEKDEYETSDEFKQFFSTSAYTVLGVSSNDDFSIVKKKYRKLINTYHPDLNPDNIELYTKISQNINEAYEKMKKFHGKK